MSIKDKLLKARSKLSIKTYKRPQLFIIMLMLVLNIFILIIAALIALAIDGSFTGFIDAFANGSLKWMLTPNAILLIDNPRTLILAVFVLVIGMVLFTGTIIALTTNAIKDYFQKKQSGSGKLILDKQIVILNWNNKVPELVADLIHLDQEDISIVILAEIDKSEAEKLIVNAIKDIKRDKNLINLNILVKKGNPLIKSDLYDISIENAKTILVMNIDNAYQDDSVYQDLNLIKSILNLGEISFKYNPPIVAEIKSVNSKEKVEMMTSVVKSLKEHLVIPICFDRRLGFVIAQTIINPLIKDVYMAMFSFEDSEVYYMENCDIEYCLKNYSHLIPVGRNGNNIFVLAEKEQDISIVKPMDINIINLKVRNIDLKTSLTVDIIGKNNKLRFIKESFADYEALYESSFVANYLKETELNSYISNINKDSSNRTILLLSDEKADSVNLDANVINNLINIQSKLKNKTNIIVEVLDPANDHIIRDFNIKNTIISNKIISLLVSKIALYKETASFYENLLTIKSDKTGKDDQNILIIQAKSILNESFPVIFSSYKQLIYSFYKSSKETLMMFGYFREQKLQLIYGDLNSTQEVTVNEDDLLVLIKI